jgi:hypothetical protein
MDGQKIWRSTHLLPYPTALGAGLTVGSPAMWGQIPAAMGYGSKNPSIVPHGGSVTLIKRATAAAVGPSLPPSLF